MGRDIVCMGTSEQKCEPGYKVGPGIRDVYIIHYIINGKGTVTINGSSFEVKKGQCFLVPAYIPVSYCADELDPWEYCWVDFSGDAALELLSLSSLCAKTPVTPVIDDVLPIMKALTQYNDQRFNKVISPLLTGYIYILLSVIARNFPSKNVSKKPLITLATEYITANYRCSDLSVEKIACKLGVSRATLCRAFSAELGTTPSKYLTNLRISRAKELFNTVDTSIKVVAYSVGFQDQMYFSKVFKSIVGASPSDYQKAVFFAQ